MRVLVVSEGKHELSPGRETGPLVELLRRMMAGEPEFVRKRVADPDVRIHKPKGKAAAYEKRALAWIKYAAGNSFDALVLLVDQDGEAERREGINNAQGNAHFRIPRALGIAVETFDAWMLADEKALSLAMGQTVQRQKSPEGIREPKSTCQTLLASSSCTLSLTAAYTIIAMNTDLDILADRCPRGFAPFRTRVEQLSSA